MAIDCEPESEQTSCLRPPRHDGLPRLSLYSLLAMTRGASWSALGSAWFAYRAQSVPVLAKWGSFGNDRLGEF